MGFPNSADLGIAKQLAVLCDMAYMNPSYDLPVLPAKSVEFGDYKSFNRYSNASDSYMVNIGGLVAFYLGIGAQYYCPLPQWVTATFDQNGKKILAIAFSGVEPVNHNSATTPSETQGFRQVAALAQFLTTEMTPQGQSLNINTRWLNLITTAFQREGRTGSWARNFGISSPTPYDAIYIAGHSWGGCFALMLAAYLNTIGPASGPIVAVHTFGTPRFLGANILGGASALRQWHWRAAGDYIPALPPSDQWPITAQKWPDLGYRDHPVLAGVDVASRQAQSWDQFQELAGDKLVVATDGAITRPTVPYLPADAWLTQMATLQGLIAYARSNGAAHPPRNYATSLAAAEADVMAGYFEQYLAMEADAADALAAEMLQAEEDNDFLTWLAGQSNLDQMQFNAAINAIQAVVPSGPPRTPGAQGTGTGDRVQTNPVPYRRHRHRNAVTTH